MLAMIYSFQRISIHALREEGDPCAGLPPLLILVFLSTPSARRATRVMSDCGFRIYISIHALREEGDIRDDNADAGHVLISIHALREEGDISG